MKILQCVVVRRELGVVQFHLATNYIVRPLNVQSALVDEP